MIWYASLTWIHHHVRGGISDIRSSCPEVFSKKGVLKDFAKFTGQHMCQISLFLKKILVSACNSIKKETLEHVFSCGFCKIFNKVARLRRAPLLKKRTWHRCFPVSFVKFLRTPFLQNTSGRLLLNSVIE